MSLLVVLVVALLAYAYVKSNRSARVRWLGQLNLPGRWVCSQAEESRELVLQGKLDQGTFLYTAAGQKRQGRWHLSGHTLHLADAQNTQQFDVHLFAPGRIGLETLDGKREVYEKAATNVVSLHAKAQDQ